MNATDARILTKLAEGSSNNGTLSRVLDLPESTVSGSLRRLVAAGLVKYTLGIGAYGSTRRSYYRVRETG